MKDAWHESIAWCESNRGKIAGYAKRYQVFTTYEIEDYINQAYLIAYETLRELGAIGRRFEQYFWVRFKSHSFKVSGCFYVDPDKFKFADNSESEDKPEPASSDDIKRILDAMTSSQRLVWNKYFEVGGRNTLVSRELGVSVDRVKKLRRDGVRRALELLNPEEQA